MFPYATPADLTTRWPSLTAPENTVELLIEDASLMLDAQYPGFRDAVDADPELASRAQIVVCSMVKRGLLTTTPGVTQESTSTGPYNHSVTYANPSGNLFVTAAEDALIRGYQPRALMVDMSL